MAYIAVAIGIFLLIKGGDWLMRAAVALSLRFSIPKIVIGMTVVSLATSAPELIVSIQSALSGHPDLALGNVVGSNIANLGFVLAIIVMISPIKVTQSFYKTDWPMMVLASLLLYIFLVFDKKLVAYEGAVLFILLLFLMVYLIKFQERAILDEDLEEDEILVISKTIAYFLLGGFSLLTCFVTQLFLEFLSQNYITQTFKFQHLVVDLCTISLKT